MPPVLAITVVRLTIHGRDLELKISAPIEPVSAQSMLPLFRSFADTFTNLSAEFARGQGKTVSCKRGCAACCRHMVALAEIEARDLRQMVLSMPEPKRREILQRFDAVLRKLQATGLLDRLRDLDHLAQSELIKLGLDYFGEQIDCPFLEDESCLIYAQRPLACREFVVTTPPEFCARPAEAKTQRIEALANVSGAIRSIDSNHEAQNRWIPLVLALEWAEANQQDRPHRPGTQWMDELLSKLREGSTGTPR